MCEHDKIMMEAVESSNLAAVGYDKEAECLKVTFKSGASYIYENVPAGVWTDILSADSVGSIFHKLVIKGGYSYAKV